MKLVVDVVWQSALSVTLHYGFVDAKSRATCLTSALQRLFGEEVARVGKDFRASDPLSIISDSGSKDLCSEF